MLLLPYLTAQAVLASTCLSSGHNCLYHSYLRSSSYRTTHDNSGQNLNSHIQKLLLFCCGKTMAQTRNNTRMHSTGRSICEDQTQVPACRASPCQEECSQFCADSLYLPLWKASNSCSYCWAATSCTTVCPMTTQPDVHRGFHDSLQKQASTSMATRSSAAEAAAYNPQSRDALSNTRDQAATSAIGTSHTCNFCKWLDGIYICISQSCKVQQGCKQEHESIQGCQNICHDDTCRALTCELFITACSSSLEAYSCSTGGCSMTA